MKTPRITVFTPAYNRADCLPNGYHALQRQTCKDFDWLIIDDGSTDNTCELVKGWQSEDNDFDIRYIRKENGGLHTAYNEAIANIDAELSVCVDSDDYMPDDAIERILDFWDKHGSDEVAGIVGLDYTPEGERLGDKLPEQKTVNLIDLLTNKYHIDNKDRKNVVRTELYKQVAPMRGFDGEKNFNPHCMHLEISKKYDFLVMNENLCFVDYQMDGMDHRMLWQYYNSPNSFAEIRLLYLSFDNLPLKFKIKHSIHYCSSCFLAKRKKFIRKSPHKVIAFLCVPFGFMLSKYILSKNKQE